MVKRIIDTAFWTDMDVIDHYSVEDKYFHLYLCTNDKSTQIGIYPLPKKVISFETGFTSEIIQVLLDRFSRTYGKIIYSEKTQEVTILHSLQYSILKGGKPVSDLLEKELSRVKDCNLILRTYEEMKEFWKLSKRTFDKTIQEIFENELITRGLLEPPYKCFEQEETSVELTMKGTNEDVERLHTEIEPAITQAEEEDEKQILESYFDYLNESTSNFDDQITMDNIVVKYYERMIEPALPSVQGILKQWEKGWAKSLILEAIHRSTNAERPIFYMNKIIENWERAGVKTYRDVIALETNI